MATTTLSIRIDPALKARLAAEAERTDRSIAYVAQKAMAAYLDAKDAKRAAIRAAIAEADKGQFVSEDVAHAWIASWNTDEEPAAPQTQSSP